jgi:hypothetical protein
MPFLDPVRGAVDGNERIAHCLLVGQLWQVLRDREQVVRGQQPCSAQFHHDQFLCKTASCTSWPARAICLPDGLARDVADPPQLGLR